MAIPDGYQRIHRLQLKLRWGDMDVLGHVNNTEYFRYFEQARVEIFDELGFSVLPDATGPVIINAHCTFLRQLRYPGEIEIITYAGAPGRSSFEMLHEVRRIDEPDVLIAEGGVKVVWVDRLAEKSVSLPAEVKQMLQIGSG
jgi:acyl-CoA thioester hydrolase